ncbi:cysteine-rich CWC family protein [Chitinophaga pendula]|uniref:cysteine-rich CWC family protein n=1 Tax=Chitinophaga TaxID=79328 RepID=UPI000BB064D1|nr:MULTISPECIES: cysteine-rich CWC family protein [Chitinophaga]ASZ14280.1 hypothetical protein CK934_26700 [Chitinophaga sp. MD30]UCJ08073.1 cysteine-rich CWC family protein [Chitinophaga pendula]
MADHETVSCPRCAATFECRVGSILRCQCQEVTLTIAERQHISEQFNGCLCANCLQEIKNNYRQQGFRYKVSRVMKLFGKR